MLSMKEVPANIISNWQIEWELWWNDFKSDLDEVDCMDYQDERQAFFAEKLGEFSDR